MLVEPVRLMAGYRGKMNVQYETEIWLKIIVRSGLIRHSATLTPLLKETNELIAILFKSVETAGKKAK